jgi:hypothetical protein
MLFLIRLDIAPGLDSKHVTPEDLSLSKIPHTTFLLKREVPGSRIAKVASQVKARVQSRVRHVRRVASAFKRA